MLAAARPAYDVLALEVWRPGVAASLAEVAAAGATNVRFCSVDAVWVLEHLVAPGVARGAVDLLPRPLAQDPAPQAPAGRRRTSLRLAPRGSPREARGGSPPTGPTTPTQMKAVLDAEPGLDRRA